jgi:hypothetical protein
VDCDWRPNQMCTLPDLLYVKHIGSIFSDFVEKANVSRARELILEHEGESQESLSNRDK